MTKEKTEGAAPSSVRATKDGRTVTVSYNFGNSLGEMADLFGEEIVFSNAKANMVIGLQARIRSLIKTEKSDEEIQAEISAWKPGIKVTRTGDPVAKIISKAEKLDSQKIEATIAALQEMLSKTEPVED